MTTDGQHLEVPAVQESVSRATGAQRQQRVDEAGSTVEVGNIEAGHKRIGDLTLNLPPNTVPSSSGLGRRPLKAVTPVRLRSGLPLQAVRINRTAFPSFTSPIGIGKKRR